MKIRLSFQIVESVKQLEPLQRLEEFFRLKFDIKKIYVILIPGEETSTVGTTLGVGAGVVAPSKG